MNEEEYREGIKGEDEGDVVVEDEVSGDEDAEVEVEQIE